MKLILFWVVQEQVLTINTSHMIMRRIDWCLQLLLIIFHCGRKELTNNLSINRKGKMSIILFNSLIVQITNAKNSIRRSLVESLDTHDITMIIVMQVSVLIVLIIQQAMNSIQFGLDGTESLRRRAWKGIRSQLYNRRILNITLIKTLGWGNTTASQREQAGHS